MKVYVHFYSSNFIIIIVIHWRILWSSHRKLACVGFEPMTTGFRSDALTDCTVRPWVQFALRANFEQPLQFHCLFSVTFHFGYCLRQSPHFFSSNFCWGNHIEQHVTAIIIYGHITCVIYFTVRVAWINNNRIE